MARTSTLVVVSIFVFCFSALQAKAQNEKNSGPIKDIYKDWMSRWSFRDVKCDTLYYTENIDNFIIDSTIESIKRTDTFTVHSLYRYSNGQPLVLTAVEKDYIVNELGSLKTFRWPDKMFPKSKVIRLLAVAEVLRLTEQLKTEDERSMCSIVYAFSKPIFFRDSSYCLYLSQAYYRTNYTQLEFYFYKMDYNRWERFSKIYIHFEHEKKK